MRWRLDHLRQLAQRGRAAAPVHREPPTDLQPALTDAVRATLSGFPGVHIHLVDALPRTATGKIRRITLAQQLHEGVDGPEA